MAKSTVSDIKKKRIGRPAVNSTPVLVRFPPAEMDPVDAWILKQRDPISRPEAIRRLVELALASEESSAPRSDKKAAKVKALAATQIDRLGDKTATADERASRKRDLLNGPEEFRDARVDRPKTKPKG